MLIYGLNIVKIFMASNDSYDSGGLWITTKFAHLSCPYINCE